MKLWYSIAALVLVLDQISKKMIEASFQLYESLHITSFFNLTLAYNKGAAFSFLSDASGWQRWFFSGIAIMVCIYLWLWLKRLTANERLLGYSLSLVLGGAIGNLIDRLAYGQVLDFLDFHYAGYHFATFNIADAAISLGAVLLIIEMFKTDNATSS